MMEAIVDTRQPQIMVEPFTRAGWKRQALKYGDYQFSDNIGKVALIEDKPLEKLLADMASGILQRQCRGLAENCDFPILLIRGHWIQDAGGYLLNSRYTWEQAWNQLQTIQDMGCRLQLATSINHAIERIFQLQQYYEKEKHDSALRQVSGDPYVVVLSLINGISSKKANSIRITLPTLRDIANADAITLAHCEGIGLTLARRIRDFFGRDSLTVY